MPGADPSNAVTRRRFVREAGLASAAAVAGAPLAAAKARGAPTRPSVLFLLADDLRWDAMSCMGHPQLKTPNLDRLAAEGVLFENAFVTTSICAPNRACILAGQHQRTTGIKDFATPFTPEQLDRTYPVLLRQAGYRTGFIGKWGVGASSEAMLKLPASRFDYWRGFVGQGKFFWDVGGKRLHLTTELVPKQAREFLDGCTPGQPFCLSISFKAPHGPWRDFGPRLKDLFKGKDVPTLPKTFTKKHFEALPAFLRNSLNGLMPAHHDARWGSRREPDRPAKLVAEYYRLIAGLDVAVGKLMAALRDKGVDQNTVVIFTSDNGHFLFEQGLMGKWLMYEPSIRVPLLVRDPRLAKARQGTRRKEMALTIDLAPTMLSMAGLPAPKAMQGRDLSPLVDGKRVPWRKDWFYDHTFTLAPPRTIAKSQGVRAERWKYVRYLDPNPNYEQLFDLTSDPDELRNLAGDPKHKDVLDPLRARLQYYRRTLPDNHPVLQEYGHYRTVHLSSEHAGFAHDFAPQRALGQTFLAEGHKVHSVRFRTPTWGKTSVAASLVAELLDGGPGGKLLARKTAPKKQVRNNRWVEIVFGQSVALGKPAYLRVRPDRPIPPRTIGWWGYEENLYPDGTGHVDGRPQEFDLQLAVTYEDPEGFVPPQRAWTAPKRRVYRIAQGARQHGRRSPAIAGRALSVRATIRPTSPNGVILAQGGHGSGYALYLKDGRLAWATRHNGKLTVVSAKTNLPKGLVRVEGRLARDGTLTLLVAGKEAARGKAPGPIPQMPGDGLECGSDHTTAVGDYPVPNPFRGVIRDALVRLDD